MNGFSLLQGQHKLAGQAWELPAWNLIDIVGWNYFLIIPESEGVNYRQYEYSNFHPFFNTWQRFFFETVARLHIKLFNKEEIRKINPKNRSLERTFLKKLLTRVKKHRKDNLI